MSLILEQPLIIKTIDNMILKARIPQAFIFYGESGTSKLDVFKYFAKELYKKELNLSDDSPVLSRIESDQHINIHYIKRDKETTISKDQIEEVIKTQAKASLEAGPIIYVIEDAMYLNKSSMNELLKFVEEPMDNVYIVFLIDNISLLQDTIISRCSLFHFLPINIDSIKERLKDEYSDESMLNACIKYYQSEKVVRIMMSDESFNKIYECIIDMFKERFEEKSSLILYFNEHIDLFKSDQLMFVSMFIYYLNDILTINYSNNITFLSEEYRIRELNNKLKINELEEILEDALEIRRLIQAKIKINTELYLINLMLKLEMKARN